MQEKMIKYLGLLLLFFYASLIANSQVNNAYTIPYDRIEKYIDEKFTEWERLIDKESVGYEEAKAKLDGFCCKAIGIYATSDFRRCIAEAKYVYDTDSETYKVDLDGIPDFYLKVPKNDKLAFEQNISKLSFYNLDLSICNDQYIILQVDVFNPGNNKKYEYDIESEYFFNGDNIQRQYSLYTVNKDLSGYIKNEAVVREEIEYTANNKVEKKDQEEILENEVGEVHEILEEGEKKPKVILLLLEKQEHAIANEEFDEANKIQGLIDAYFERVQDYSVISDTKLIKEIRVAFKKEDLAIIEKIKSELIRRGSVVEYITKSNDELEALLEEAIKEENSDKANSIKEELNKR